MGRTKWIVTRLHRRAGEPEQWGFCPFLDGEMVRAWEQVFPTRVAAVAAARQRAGGCGARVLEGRYSGGELVTRVVRA